MAEISLLEAIEADPDDPDSYQVYADWLQGRGDPRGELIALQLANLDTQAEEHLEQHKHEFLGDAAEHEYGFTLHWRWGFIRSLRVLDNTRPPVNVIEALLQHESAALLRTLELRGSVEAIARRRRATLRRLVLTLEYDPADFEPMWPQVPRLHELRLFGEASRLETGTMDLPQLEILEIQPAIEAWWRPLLEDEFVVPNLKNLRLASAARPDDVVEAMFRATVRPQLTSLNWDGPKSIETMREFLVRIEEFRHIGISFESGVPHEMTREELDTLASIEPTIFPR